MTRLKDLKRMNYLRTLAVVFAFGFASSIFAKDLPGATQTSYGVSASGAFQFQIPIVVPAGRNGMQPNLSLSFSSGGGNGSVGVGWGVSGLGAITRCGRNMSTDNGVKGGVLHDANDKFCLNGRRLILVGTGAYGGQNTEYRTEVDSFAKIMARGSVLNAVGGSAPEFWEVQHKDGMVQEYGNTDTSKFTVTGDSIHSWRLNKTSDRAGNNYSASYVENYRLPDEINYDGGHTVKFTYEARNDIRTSYVVGQKITRNKRLSSITVTKNIGGVQTIRSYALGYEYAGISKKSRLKTVTECGLSSSDCMPAISIEWKAEVGSFAAATAAADKPKHAMIEHYDYQRSLGNNGQTEADVKQINYGAWVDVNGDGKRDQVIAYKTPGGTDVFKTFLKTEAGWSTDESAWHLPEPLRSYDNSIVNTPYHARFVPDVVNQGQLVDVNGDGLVDVVYAYRLYEHPGQNADVKEVLETYLNSPTGFSANPSPQYAPKAVIHDYTTIDGGDYKRMETVRGRLVDINGDGLVDWVEAYQHHIHATNYQNTWLNTGSGWAAASTNSYELPDVFVEYSPRPGFNLPHGQLLDVNGDGLLDWVQAYKKSGPHETVSPSVRNTWINTGTGWSNIPDPIFRAPEAIYEGNLGHNAPFPRGSFVDVNGDGRPDWVHSYISYTVDDSDTNTYINTGRGWSSTAHAGYKPEFVQFDASRTSLPNQYDYLPRDTLPLLVGGFYVDVNRDGLVDYTESFKPFYDGTPVQNTWINTGDGWLKDNTYNTDDLFFDYFTNNAIGNPILKIGHGQMVDIDSNGSPDWVNHRSGQTLSSKLNQLSRTDQLEEVTTTMGVEVRPVFKPLVSSAELYEKGSGATETNAWHMTGSMYVVSELSVSSGNGGGYNKTQYAYSGAQVHREGRGFLGFKTFESRNVATGLTQKSTFSQEYPFIGRALESTVRETANTTTSEWLSITNNNYLSQNLNGSKTVFAYLKDSTTQKAELEANGGGVYQWAKTTNAYATGNYGRLQSSTTEVGTSASALTQQNKTIVGYTYHPANTGDWLIGLVKDTTTTTSEPAIGISSQKTRKDAYEYFDTTGYLHTTTREPDSSDTAITLLTTYSYDAYGNIKGETTGSGLQARTNTIVYDPDTSNRLPKTLTNALLQDSTITYHPQCDAPVTATAVDGVVTTYTYDNFCRQTSLETADITQTSTYQYAGSASAIPIAKCGVSGCSVIPRFSMTSQVQDVSGNTQPEVTAFYNLYGKAFLSVTNGMAVGQVIKQETEYDGLGRVERQSQPYYEGDTKYWTSNVYDLLGRVTKTILSYAGLTTTNAEVISGFTVDTAKRQKRTTTNTLGDTKTVFANALGQITEVKDARGKSLLYDYDSQGNLIKTTDSANNEIVVTYDALGRRKSLDDPDLGYIVYELDAFSQQVKQTDAKDQVIEMVYDKLGRMTERKVAVSSLPGSASETSYFAFDDPNPVMNAIGKLSSIKKGINGQQQDSKHFGYDAFGRPDATITYVKGHRFAEAVTYNDFGQLDTREYPASGVDANTTPNRFAVKYDYINGYLSEISGIDANNAKCITHWKAEEYDALGRTKVDTLGDFITTTRTYDPAQGVLKKIESIVNVGIAGTVQNIDYTYDENNNLKVRSESYTHNGNPFTKSETFTYDELDRLRYHNQGSSEEVEVRYDDIGNIEYKSDVGSYLYSGDGGPHAVSRVNSPLGSYDPLAKFQVNWEWNGEPVINQNQANITDDDYAYDDNGNITKQGNRNVTWTAFDKPASMTLTWQDGTQRGSLIEYDAQFNRHFKQEAAFDGMGIVTAIKESTYYVGKEYEKTVKENGEVLHRYTISTGGGTIQVEREDGTVKDKPMYMLGDNLGSTNVIINGLGEVEQRLAFDPWGMRTAVDGFSDAVNGVTNKGYTGHEMDDEVGLINMNARIYDPVLGRFLSADPVLQDPYNMASFNRYSYVWNNPLKYTDPTGNEVEVDGPDDKPIEEIIVKGSRISPPPANGAQRHSTVDAGYSGGGDALFFRDGQFGTEGELFGVVELEVNLVEDVAQFENESQTSLADTADEIKDAREREDGAGNGRLRNNAREDRENAERDYIDQFSVQIRTIVFGLDGSVSGWLGKLIGGVEYDIGGAVGFAIDLDAWDAGFVLTRSAGVGAGIARGARFAELSGQNLENMAGVNLSIDFQAGAYGGGISRNSLTIRGGFGLEAQLMSNTTTVYSFRRAFRTRSFSGGVVDSGCENSFC